MDEAVYSFHLDKLSATFANNLGADNSTVFDGAITLASANLPGPGNTKLFDIVINLTTPFLYDPGKGNLLLELRNFGTGFTGFIDLTASPTTQLVFADNAPNATTGSVQGFGLVTRFTAVPEPFLSDSAANLFGKMLALAKEEHLIDAVRGKK